MLKKKVLSVLLIAMGSLLDLLSAAAQLPGPDEGKVRALALSCIKQATKSNVTTRGNVFQFVCNEAGRDLYEYLENEYKAGRRNGIGTFSDQNQEWFTFNAAACDRYLSTLTRRPQYVCTISLAPVKP